MECNHWIINYRRILQLTLLTIISSQNLPFQIIKKFIQHTSTISQLIIIFTIFFNVSFLILLLNLYLNQNKQKMKRKPCLKDEKQQVHMTTQNLKICISNQQGAFQTLELNQSLHLQYYGFSQINCLHSFPKLHTLFLNNNLIQSIQNLDHLPELRTLNLSYNQIRSVQNINCLKHLYSLDLSNNLIQSVVDEKVNGLINLNNLKLGNNRFIQIENVLGLAALEALTYLDLSGNQELQYNPSFYSQFLGKSKVSVLNLGNTTFSRAAPNYRKQTINEMKNLKFLDERPVTEQERMLAQAWKSGGKQLQRQVKSKLRQKLISKHDQIYKEMQQRNSIVQEKRRRVYEKLTNNQLQKEKELSKLRQNEQQYEILSENEKSVLNLKLQQIQKYLQLMQQSVKDMDLQKELSQGKVILPSMLIEKQTPEAIYIYNISQEQIPLIKEKYYPNESRPLIAKNYQNENENRWIIDYDTLLKQVFEQCRGDWQFLVPMFNLQLYDFDKKLGRKIRRFETQELKFHLTGIELANQRTQQRIQAYDQLD